MSLSNSSQLLLKNIDRLQGQNPLIINCPDRDFIEQFKQHDANRDITCLHYDYGNYQETQRLTSAGVNSYFGLNYQAKVRHDLVIIFFPKSKAELELTLALINCSLAADALLYFVGDNKGGIKSCAKLIQNTVQWQRKEDAARHCILFAGLFNNQRSEFDLESWFKKTEVNQGQLQFTIFSLPGVFSHERLDKGTAILLDQLDNKMTGKLLDFGCGTGVIGVMAALLNPSLKPEFVDVNALALASTERTLAYNKIKGKVFPSNSLHHINEKYDIVLSNPPFHQGIKTNYEATEYFLNQLKTRLNSRGRALIVANSFLAYKPILTQHFNEYREKAKESGFTVHQVTANA